MGLTHAEIQGFRPLLLDLHVPASASAKQLVDEAVAFFSREFGS